MKLFRKSHDGGPNSGVTGYWLIEAKSLFSIVLLRFSPGSREAFHNHAFNAWTWWLAGEAEEVYFECDPPKKSWSKIWLPSWKPKWTPRNCFHKILGGKNGAWALSFRGPWDATWQENKNGQTYTLGHGRVIIDGQDKKDAA